MWIGEQETIMLTIMFPQIHIFFIYKLTIIYFDRINLVSGQNSDLSSKDRFKIWAVEIEKNALNHSPIMN